MKNLKESVAEDAISCAWDARHGSFKASKENEAVWKAEKDVLFAGFEKNMRPAAR